MHSFRTHSIAGAALVIAFTFTVQAQNSRSFVATTGDDTNACSANAYCRTFGRAFAVTNSGGEIVVVNSGGYGSFSITQPVTITALGIDASITVTSNNAIGINTSGDVTITGLNLFGGGTGNDGILVQGVGNLRLFNVQIQNFSNDCIEFDASGGNLAINDSQLNDCAVGLYQNAGNAYVRNTKFNNNNGAGAESVSAHMTIVDSSAQYNNVGFAAFGGTVSLQNDRIVFNGDGISVAFGGTLDFANCLIAGNTNSYVNTSSTVTGSSPGTSLIAPGQSSSGSLGTAIAFQ
jgi:hypothetical protein